MNPQSPPAIRARVPTLRLLHRSCAFLLACFALNLFAQSDGGASGTGRITGVVTNQATGDTLAGAIIEVEGTNIRTVSERGGTYELTAPAGSRVLLVTYSGLDRARATVSVSPGSVVRRDVEMTSDVYVMEPVTVAGVREGNALAIQTQRLADNAKWVSAVDTFGNPAANPGELIQRMPGITTDIVGGEVRTIFLRGMGPGFASLLVDGEQMASSTGSATSRDYQIEQFGTGNLDSVEVIKAPQPDQDANAVAGYVNLVSRRAFDAPGRRITFTAGTIWRDRQGVSSASPFKDRADDLDILNFSYSDVYSVLGGQRNLGVTFNFSRRISSTTQDEIGIPAYVTGVGAGHLNGNTDNPLQRRFGMGDFVHPSMARNAGLNLDYKLSPDAYVFANFTFNTNNNEQQGYRFSVGNTAATAAHFAAGSTYEHSTLLPHAASQAESRQWPAFSKNARSYSVSTGTEFKLFDRSLTVSLRGTYSHADISYPGTVLLLMNTTDPAGIGFELDRRGQEAFYPIFRQTAGASVYDPASYRMNTMSRTANRAPNDVVSFRADVTKAFDMPVLTSIKAGLKYNDNRRSGTRDIATYTFVGADGVAGTPDDVATPFVNLLYKQGTNKYGPFPFVTDMSSVPDNYWRTTAAQAYNDAVSKKTGDVKFAETISAAYVQGRLRFGKLGVLTGVRVEQTETEGTDWVRNTTASWGGNSVGGSSFDPAVINANLARAERSFVDRKTARGKYTNVFPGMHFTYRVTDSLLARASYNRSIARPPVARLVPTVSENIDNMSVSIGNPNLKPYQSDNFEVSLEKYFEPVGLFSVGAFLKEITNYFRSFSSTVGPEGVDGSGEYPGYTLTRFSNIGSARVRGIEASYQQQFSFLPGAFKGLGAQANFTYLETYGDFGNTTTTTVLPNLVPRSGNLGLNYRFRGLDARVLLNYTGESYRGTNSGVDFYSQARKLVDVKLQYTIRRNYDLFLDITNLTNEATTTVITKNGIEWFRADQGVLYYAGIRGRF